MEIVLKFGFKHFFLGRGTIYLNQKSNSQVSKKWTPKFQADSLQPRVLIARKLQYYIGLERLQIDDV